MGARRIGEGAFGALTFRLAVLVLLALAPAVAAQLYNQARLREAREAEVRLVAHGYARLVSDKLDGVFGAARTLLLAVGELPAAKRLDGAVCSRFVTELENLHGGLYGVGAADAEGRLFCAPAGAAGPQTIADRGYFQEAVAGSDVAIGEAVTGRVSGKLIVPLARRFERPGAGPAGVAVATVRLDKLIELLGQLPLPPGASISVLDRRGTILVRMPDTQLVGGETPQPFRWMLTAERGGTFDSSPQTASDGVARLVGFIAPPENAARLAVAVGIPRQGALAELRAAQWREASVLAGGACLGLALAMLLARRWIGRPIDGLAAVADRLRRGDLRARADPRGAGGELARLAEAFNAMAAALEARHVDRERLAAIVESSEDAIYSRGLDGKVLTWNRGAERLLGWRADEIVGRSSEITFPPERLDELRALMERARRGESASVADTERLDREGRRVSVSVQVSPIRGADGEVAAASVILRGIAEHKRALERQRILLAELDHRVKNALAVVQSLIHQSLPPSPERATLLGRLAALASAHGLLSDSRWHGASLPALLSRELAPYGAERGRLSGPPVELGPKAAQTFALILHELATNSAKYGALSQPGGGVDVDWSLSAEGLTVDWRERGGPPVEPPRRKGFGLRVIDALLTHDLGGSSELRFEAEGLRCRIRAPLAALAEAGGAAGQP